MRCEPLPIYLLWVRTHSCLHNCIRNVTVHGTEENRNRIVQAGMLEPVVGMALVKLDDGGTVERDVLRKDLLRAVEFLMAILQR